MPRITQRITHQPCHKGVKFSQALLAKRRTCSCHSQALFPKEITWLPAYSHPRCGQLVERTFPPVSHCPLYHLPKRLTHFCREYSCILRLPWTPCWEQGLTGTLLSSWKPSCLLLCVGHLERLLWEKADQRREGYLCGMARGHLIGRLLKTLHSPSRYNLLQSTSSWGCPHWPEHTGEHSAMADSACLLRGSLLSWILQSTQQNVWGKQKKEEFI